MKFPVLVSVFFIAMFLTIMMSLAKLGKRKSALPYKKRDVLLSRAENDFFQVLRSVAGGRCFVFSKVRLGDLLYVPKGAQNAASFRNQIQQKHIDFVLCDTRQIAPILAIELDDRSHEREDRKARDRFVEEALETAGLPLLRVRAAQSYSAQDLMEEIRRVIATTRPTESRATARPALEDEPVLPQDSREEELWEEPEPLRSDERPIGIFGVRNRLRRSYGFASDSQHRPEDRRR